MSVSIAHKGPRNYVLSDIGFYSYEFNSYEVSIQNHWILDQIARESVEWYNKIIS